MRARILVIVLFIFLIVIVSSLIDSFIHGEIDKPKKSDVIILLGGDHGRLEKVAELYNNGYAEHVIITPVSETYNPQSIELAIDSGIPEEVIIKDYEATSTYSNATVSMKLMENYNFESALIVTSDYHLKRAKMIFERLNSKNYSFLYIAAYGPNGESWYERPDVKNLWFSELYKLWGYRFGLYKFVDVPDVADVVE